MEQKTLRLKKTKKSLPAMWEAGGSATNTGKSQVVAGVNGQAMRPLYIRRAGHLACGEHALFVVKEGCVVVSASHHRGDFSISVSVIAEIVFCDYEMTLEGGFSEADMFGPEYPSAFGELKLRQNRNFPVEGGAVYAVVKRIAEFSQGEWDFPEVAGKFSAAIEAAKEKAVCYHCREPHFAAAK